MEPMSLTELAAEHLAAAHPASSGRSSVTVGGGREHNMRQNLLALVAGQELGEHESPGEASLQVIQGEVRLSAGGASWELHAGDYMLIPRERHDLKALSDAVVLLTVVKEHHH